MRAGQGGERDQAFVARVMSFDDDSLATVLIVAMLGQREPTAPGRGHRRRPAAPVDLAVRGGTAARDRHKGPGRPAGADRRLFDEEMARFRPAIDSAGTLDDSAATRLYQATYSLEVAR